MPLEQAIDDLGQTALRIKGERDALLAIVEKVAAIRDYSLPRSEVATLVMEARAALAKAEGRS